VNPVFKHLQALSLRELLCMVGQSLFGLVVIFSFIWLAAGLWVAAGLPL
jgi:hypothetical protein